MIERLFNKIPKDQLYIFESIEENKTIESALQICEIMTNIPAKRNAKLISFGGGIVQDVTGFVANVLYRGIHWTFYPTTLLAACDSCIGGKHIKLIKNLKSFGNFFIRRIRFKYVHHSLKVCRKRILRVV